MLIASKFQLKISAKYFLKISFIITRTNDLIVIKLYMKNNKQKSFWESTEWNYRKCIEFYNYIKIYDIIWLNESIVCQNYIFKISLVIRDCCDAFK